MGNIFPWVKKYIGIPFVSNGRTLQGADCYGLVRLVLKNEYNIELPELSDDYSNALNLEQTEKMFKENLPVLTAEKISAPEERSVIVITEHGVPAHIGIYAGGGFILHMVQKTGSICQKETHPALRGRIEGYYYVG
jgi:cell wall-associated NlpC family hydrolase